MAPTLPITGLPERDSPLTSKLPDGKRLYQFYVTLIDTALDVNGITITTGELNDDFSTRVQLNNSPRAPESTYVSLSIRYVAGAGDDGRSARRAPGQHGCPSEIVDRGRHVFALRLRLGVTCNAQRNDESPNERPANSPTNYDRSAARESIFKVIISRNDGAWTDIRSNEQKRSAHAQGRELRVRTHAITNWFGMNLP
ncbi:hypothetical protein EVAR_644_1 [Eumeta japonica]|uniref:Uncharacterized protein n=1 Tax=Eumeta variegata TaxID=151549 RepID=A0A4C1SBG0_EUMVA|nr:hypothetical protein EVAR_644_1 [Eumeta japonica]